MSAPKEHVQGLANEVLHEFECVNGHPLKADANFYQDEGLFSVWVECANVPRCAERSAYFSVGLAKLIEALFVHYDVLSEAFKRELTDHLALPIHGIRRHKPSEVEAKGEDATENRFKLLEIDD